MPWIEDRGQTDRVTTPTRAGLRRWPRRVSSQLLQLQHPAVVAVIIYKACRLPGRTEATNSVVPVT